MSADVTNQIKSAMRLSDYVNQFTISPLKGSGGEGKFIGFCPFHDNTKSPAFSVNDQRGLWNCFAGCGSGSIFDFWLVQHGYDPRDRGNFGLAVEGLAQEFGIEMPEYKSEKKEISPTRIKKALDAVATAATNYLLDSDDDSAVKAYDYIKSRGFTDRLIKKYRLGFLPDSNRAATKLIVKSVGDDYGVKAAIAGAALHQGDGEPYTSLWGRLTVPITDKFGNVVGFGAREVPDVPHHSEAKWINPTSTSVYDKSKLLFDGGEIARAKKLSKVVICEGYFDAIAVTESELDAIGLAVCGTSTTPGHLDYISSADEVTFMFDGDEAGMNATSKLTWAINKRDDLFAVLLPDGIDPFDVVFDPKGDLTISQLVSAAKPLLTVAVDVERKRKDKNDEFDKWVANAIAAIDSEFHKNDLAGLAAKKRGQTRSAYIRNLSRINVSSIKINEVHESKIDPNAASLIAFMLNLSDDEKDGLFYNLDDDTVVTVLKQWLQMSSDISLAVATSVLFGNSLIDSDIPQREIDVEMARLMSTEGEDVDISRALKSALSSLGAFAKELITRPSTSDSLVQRILAIRDLTLRSEDIAAQKDILALFIDLAVDIAEEIDADEAA